VSENQIADLIGQIPGKGAGKYMERLTDDSREVLDAFQTWLVTDDGKAETTARSYKLYVAEALCHVIDGGNVSELSTDVRSALNALKRFQEAGVVEGLAAEAAEPEGDEEEDGDDGSGEREPVGDDLT
jgi:hypothetical protein